jgi:hypothetical protein
MYGKKSIFSPESTYSPCLPIQGTWTRGEISLDENYLDERICLLCQEPQFV